MSIHFPAIDKSMSVSVKLPKIFNKDDEDLQTWCPPYVVQLSNVLSMNTQMQIIFDFI